MTPALLEARSLEKTFSAGGWLRSRRDVRAVAGVDLDVRRGECLAVVGESGCGKTTLARLLVRLVQPTSGRVVFDGIDLLALRGRALRRIRRRFQMVFQDPWSSLNPRMRAGAIVGEPLSIHGLARGSAKEDRVRELLDLVGLPRDAASRYPHQFSGGQRQRIGIARALASEPDLLVADEPVSALDVSIQAQVVNLLARLQRELGLALLFIAHDLALVESVADRVAVMYLGRIVEIGDRDEIFARPLHPYTALLMRTAPRLDPEAEPRGFSAGEPPSPEDPPAGCPFHPRCPAARDRCRRIRPHLEKAEDGRSVACYYPGEG